MPKAMPGHAAGFPTAIHLGLGLETRFLAKPCEEAVRLQPQQIRLVGLHGLFERAFEQTDIGEIKWLDLHGNSRFDDRLRAR